VENERASETAVLTGAMRAAHLLMDHEPWVFRDPLAGALVGMDNRAALDAVLSSIENELGGLAKSHLLLARAVPPRRRRTG
jgi:O-methyltransferase involved in polyketide biosynthesis